MRKFIGSELVCIMKMLAGMFPPTTDQSIDRGLNMKMVVDNLLIAWVHPTRLGPRAKESNRCANS